MTFPNIATIIGNVVAACRATGSDAPYFYYGHALEIVNTLMEKDKSDNWKLKKYPAVFLFVPITEERDEFTSKMKLDIVIVTETRPEWKAADRDANVFVPKLLPIYDALIEQLSRSSELNFSGVHEFTKHYFWGSSQTDKNVANDYADAIELKGVEVETWPSCTDDDSPEVAPTLESAFSNSTGSLYSLVFSKSMSEPDIANFDLMFDGVSVTIDSININVNDVIYDLTTSEVPTTDTVITVSVAGGVVVAIDNSVLDEVTNFEVENNVL